MQGEQVQSLVRELKSSHMPWGCKKTNIMQKQCSNKTPPIRTPPHRGEESAQLLQDIQETHLHRELTTPHTGWFRGLTILS